MMNKSVRTLVRATRPEKERRKERAETVKSA